MKVIAGILAAIALLGLLYLAIFGRALSQDENHLAIALSLPKIVFSAEAVRIDDDTYVAKNTASFLKTMEREGFAHVEQLGAGHFFTKDGERFVSTSRMYSSHLMTFRVPQRN